MPLAAVLATSTDISTCEEAERLLEAYLLDHQVEFWGDSESERSRFARKRKVSRCSDEEMNIHCTPSGHCTPIIIKFFHWLQ